MKNYLKMASVILLCAACTSTPKPTENPLLGEWNTPHQTPPFSKIQDKDYEPAFKIAMEEGKKEIDAIINNKEEATFENTIVALDNAGSLLSKVAGVFYNVKSANVNDSLQAIAVRMSPLMSDYSSYINLNKDLFARIKTVYAKKEALKLNPEQTTLLEDAYKGFVRAGANLSGKDKERYKEISKRLSELSLKFDENEHKETNAFELLITDKKELKGLPESALEASALAAKESKKEGYLFNLQYPSYGPIMRYAENRELREKFSRARGSVAFKNNEFNNTEVIREITSLRLERANLLGFKSYSDFVLDNRMAENADNVNNFLKELLEASHKYTKIEVKEVEDFARKNGFKGKQLQSWDFGFYSRKLKEAKYSLDDEIVKQYFPLAKVQEGVFGLAHKLYGINFKEVKNIDTYHKDVQTFEVTDADGKFLSVLYTDFFPRESKQSGAWMNGIRDQKMLNGKDRRPLVTIVMNFTKPTETKPSLLTMGEVETFLHEFGHSLHGMLTKCTYGSVSGTSVMRDFVELPSQVMENWAMEKEWLDTFAVHYKTGEKMPAELIQKIKNASNYLAAYGNDRQVSFAMIDMAYHSITKPIEGKIIDFEKAAFAPTQVLPSVEGSCFSTAFGHIFAGGYASGYYGYKWAEVLDADAFSVFKKNGIFNKETANSFRTNILENGGSEHPMKLYIRFRGQKPTNEALLKRMGLIK
ncbi:MAG: M3 family metallopeptidase [Marinifilaceae bacterium]